MRYLTALAILLSLLFVPLLAPSRTKPMAKLVTISEDSLRELARLRDLNRRLLAIEAKLAADRRTEDPAGPRTVRWGKTTTNDEFPDYPTSGNTVLVELGDYAYDNTDVGDQPVTWEAYDPPEHRIARTMDGSLPGEASVVPLQLHHGRWWISALPGVKLGIVKVGTRGRYHTPPLPDISTTASCTVELIEFTETSTSSGIWQATRTGTVITATHLSTWILLNDTIVVCIPPPHPGAPWIVFPYPTPANFPQLDAIWQPYSTPDALSSTWLEINDIWDCDTSPTTQGGSAAQPVYAHQSSGDKDIVISSPGLYHISLTAEMAHTGITTPPVTCEVGLSLSDSTAIFMSTYATFEAVNDCNKITPRVSETLELDYPSFSFPQRIKAFVRAVGLTGSDAATCNWLRVHIQPAGYGENQSSQSFPGWATTPPY